ncbi:hypothetical protein MJL27_27260, partial [Salmonella enterica subsp. enterica serovar Anatum]|nr:hypothetical protein [Salmonella enterica subsp. enterica serovar Anatum]
WGVGVVGSLHIGRVISWNGIVTYGAMAMGAPLGVLCYAWGGLRQKRNKRAGYQYRKNIAEIRAGGHIQVFNDIAKGFPPFDNAF